jgi:hypothetical protein
MALAGNIESEANQIATVVAGKVSSPPVIQGSYPSETEIKTVQRAIQAFDRKDLSTAQNLFTRSIDRWEELGRPRSLLLLPKSDSGFSRIYAAQSVVRA